MIGLFCVKEEGWTGFSKGWQGCSEGFPKGEARGKSWWFRMDPPNDTYGSVWPYLTSSTICSHYISTVGEFRCTIAIMQEKQQNIPFEIECKIPWKTPKDGLLREIRKNKNWVNIFSDQEPLNCLGIIWIFSPLFPGAAEMSASQMAHTASLSSCPHSWQPAELG